MISPFFLNCNVEIFEQVIVRNDDATAAKTLRKIAEVRGACDLEIVTRIIEDNHQDSMYRAMVFIDGGTNLRNTHWARITADVSGFVIFGQLETVSQAGLIGDHVEFSVVTGEPLPEIEEESGSEP